MKQQMIQKQQWRPSKRDYQAYGLMLVACFIWVASFIYPSEHKIHFVQNALNRSVTCFLGNYIGAKFFLKDKLLFDNYSSRKYFIFMNFRSFCLSVYALAMPCMMFYLPMPVVHTIAGSSIVVVSILDYLIYGVKINRTGIIGIFLGLLGVLIMANDSIIIGYLDPSFEFTSQFEHYIDTTVQQRVIVSFSLFFVISLFAFTIVTTKSLKGLSAFEINFHNSIYTIIGSGILYPFIEQKSDIITMLQAILFVGIPVFVSQGLFTLSIQLASKTGVVMVLNTSNILYAYIFSIFHYHQKVHFISISGGICIVSACILILLFKV